VGGALQARRTATAEASSDAVGDIAVTRCCRAAEHENIVAGARCAATLAATASPAAHQRVDGRARAMARSSAARISAAVQIGVTDARREAGSGRRRR
jgi:hypothetical protein